MDEAISLLDIESENCIANQLKELKGRFTIIIISHYKIFLKIVMKFTK